MIVSVNPRTIVFIFSINFIIIIRKNLRCLKLFDKQPLFIVKNWLLQLIKMRFGGSVNWGFCFIPTPGPLFPNH